MDFSGSPWKCIPEPPPSVSLVARTVVQDVREQLWAAEMVLAAAVGTALLARAGVVWLHPCGWHCRQGLAPCLEQGSSGRMLRVPPVIARNKGPRSARLCSHQEDQVMSE